MKRYLVWSLLVINAVPAQAAQHPVCKGIWGCETWTGWTDYFGLTAAAQQEAEEKMRLEAEALTKKRKQEELDNVPTRVQIIAMTQETLENNKKLVEMVQQAHNEEDNAIATINAEDTKALAVLLEACKNGLMATCAEHKINLDHIYERSTTSNQRATQQGTLNTKRAQLAQDLEKYKEEMLAAYEEMKAITVKESEDLTPFTKKRLQATDGCDEGNACNAKIEAIDLALTTIKDGAQEKRREAKAKLDDAWKKYIAIRDSLNDVSDINAIAEAFPRKYSVTPAEVLVTRDAKLVFVAKTVVTENQEGNLAAVTRSAAVENAETSAGDALANGVSTKVDGSADKVQTQDSAAATNNNASAPAVVVKEEKAGEQEVDAAPASEDKKQEDLPKESAAQ